MLDAVGLQRVDGRGDRALERVLDRQDAVRAAALRHRADDVAPRVKRDEPCEIGTGTRIWHFVHILPRTRIGRDCSLGQNVMVGPDVTIGDNCKVQNNVSIYEGVTLEDDVFCGPSMVFTNVINPRSHVVRRDEAKRREALRGDEDTVS